VNIRRTEVGHWESGGKDGGCPDMINNTIETKGTCI
jgi:hypothetical protein